MSNKRFISIPRFKNETQEREFWLSHDSTDYVDWGEAERVRFPNLKPSSKAISLRVPVALLERIKIEANRRDVPYQSLIKIWLAEKVDSAVPPSRHQIHRPPTDTRQQQGSNISK